MSLLKRSLKENVIFGKVSAKRNVEKCLESFKTNNESTKLFSKVSFAKGRDTVSLWNWLVGACMVNLDL